MYRFVAVFLMITLASCGPKISESRDFDLCYDLARGANLGDRNGALKNEIKKRRLNCDKYEVAVQVRLAESDAQFRRNINKAVETMSSDNRDANARLDQLERDLRFNCTMSGGVLIGGICNK